MKEFAPILVIIIVVMAVLLSSPESKQIFSGGNFVGNQSQNTQTQTSNNTGSNNSTQSQYAKKGLTSPFADYVTIKNLQTGEEYNESYDSLLLSPGARPIRAADRRNSRAYRSACRWPCATAHAHRAIHCRTQPVHR